MTEPKPLVDRYFRKMREMLEQAEEAHRRWHEGSDLAAERAPTMVPPRSPLIGRQQWERNVEAQALLIENRYRIADATAYAAAVTATLEYQRWRNQQEEGERERHPLHTIQRDPDL